MRSSRKIPVCACDYCVYMAHRVWQNRSGLGNFCYIMLDVEGYPSPDEVRAGVTRALCAHPALMMPIGVSPLQRRPFWQVPVNPEGHAEQVARQVHVFDDLRHCGDALAEVADLCQERYHGRWYGPGRPQVRLEQYALPNGLTRFVIRWPHYLMDADGAQWFLAAVGAQAHPGAAQPAGLAAVTEDHEQPRVLAGYSWMDLFRIVRRTLAAARVNSNLRLSYLLSSRSPRTSDYRFIHRHWSAEQFAAIRAHAKRTTPPGPALYVRYMAAAVGRAQERIYAEQGMKTEVFLITFPLRVGTSLGDENFLSRRPLLGNYLVTPVLVLPVRVAADRAALEASIHRQVQEFLAIKGDLAQWTLLEAAALLHPWCYPWIFKLPLTVARCSSGFSYYSGAKVELEWFVGAKVLNSWGGGPTSTPPAWNPVFHRYGGLLNMSVTYSRPAIADELGTRYADLIESELLNPT
jgi:hypothetical protein